MIQESDLFSPFGYSLGEDQQHALKFEGASEWKKAKTTLPQPDSPVYAVDIWATDDFEVYRLVYWRGTLAKIQRLGLFGEDNTEAQARYKKLFRAFQGSLRRLAYDTKLEYTERFEATIGQRKVRAYYHPYRGGRFKIAQFSYSIENMDAAAEMEAYQEQLRKKDRETKGTYAYSIIGCEKKVTGKNKFLEMAVITRTSDMATCRRVNQNKIALFRSGSFWVKVEGECDDRTSTNELFAAAFNDKLAMKLYVSFKDLDGFETRVNFMGATLPAARALAQVVKDEFTRLGFQNIKIIEPAP
ncbi:hypothetical protein MYX84_12425 [Acidobacteria bacterium AH-259-O06]|nr:hypothetical protein [Acidobacteria bacterium AH-259-O06]